MSNDYKEFVSLRDDLFLGMTEAAQELVASSSIDDTSQIIAALLAAHIACCQHIFSQIPDEVKEKWYQEFIAGIQKILLKNGRSLNTLH